jgi:hypothetical protein
MRARRVCACGAELLEAGDALACTGCGARARAWRVLLDGTAIAAGTLPAHHGNPEVAFAATFEAGLRGLLAPTQPIRYAVPSSWRRRHRKRRVDRG